MNSGVSVQKGVDSHSVKSKPSTKEFVLHPFIIYNSCYLAGKDYPVKRRKRRTRSVRFPRQENRIRTGLSL